MIGSLILRNDDMANKKIIGNSICFVYLSSINNFRFVPQDLKLNVLLMKRFLTFAFLCLISLVFAQPTINRFDDNSQSAFENEAVETTKETSESSEYGKGPGNPGDTVPIDEYIPLLVLTALGIIIYKTRKNRNLLS